MADFPRIPGYKILTELGEGGVATVYLGIQERLNRKVAIKILKPLLLKDKVTALRFEREAKTAAMLSHSNIIQIFDIGKAGDYHYIVMEYLEESLKERMMRSPKGRMHPEMALDIVEEMMKALDYAHFRGVYHRDIKPENIMFRQDGTPVLVDFGIARVYDATDKLTKNGMIIGTVDYMSPEQCSSQEVDGRSDIYSLGVVFYEMLTGDTPYRGNSPLTVALGHIDKPVPRLPQQWSRYQRLIDKMMAKDIEKRISSGPELVQVLDRILTGAENSTPQPIESSSPLTVETSLFQTMESPFHPTEIILADPIPKKPEMPGRSFFSKHLNLIVQKLYSFSRYIKDKLNPSLKEK